MTDYKKYKAKVNNDVINELKEYRKEAGRDSGYNFIHISKCKRIILKYLKQLNSLKNISNESILSLVKIVVLNLNKLNEKTEYCLIETEARESIWEIIQFSAIDQGLKLDNEQEDITEQWREW